MPRRAEARVRRRRRRARHCQAHPRSGGLAPHPAGRIAVRDRPRPRGAGGRLPAIAVAVARYRGFASRSVLDYGRRPRLIARKYHGALPFPTQGETDSVAATPTPQKAKEAPMLDKSPNRPAVNVPNDLAAHWMPFTANRAFKKNPRLLAGAKDMHYFTVDGRKIIDGASG